jgi:hypothetical protein
MTCSHHMPQKIGVDLLLTVGSQVGLFEELKPFKNSNRAVRASAVVPKPANVGRWIRDSEQMQE